VRAAFFGQRINGVVDPKSLQPAVQFEVFDTGIGINLEN
jgi:hypothetical protein